MASEVLYAENLTSRSYEFLVGQTRAHTITSNLRETPHLLVAGQTGGGKSTFAITQKSNVPYKIELLAVQMLTISKK